MKKNYTHIVVVLDRSGSMISVKNDMEQGLKYLLDEQKKVEGEATISLYKFDDHVESVFHFSPLAAVEKIELEPRGFTALYDALGQAVDETGRYLAAMPEPLRPERVIVVVITDGDENHSSKFTQRQVFDKITQQTERYNWQFTYLGANQDALKVGHGLGIRSSASYNASQAGVQHTHSILSGKMAAFRNAGAFSEYTTEELAAMNQK